MTSAQRIPNVPIAYDSLFRLRFEAAKKRNSHKWPLFAAMRGRNSVRTASLKNKQMIYLCVYKKSLFAYTRRLTRSIHSFIRSLVRSFLPTESSCDRRIPLCLYLIAHFFVSSSASSPILTTSASHTHTPPTADDANENKETDEEMKRKEKKIRNEIK